MALLMYNHDQDDILIRPPSPRFDRRVLLASAAALGLTAAVGPVPEVWAKGGAKKRTGGIPEPKAMDKKEAALAMACLKALNRARASVLVGAGGDESKWSPLQHVVVDPVRSRFVNMHLEAIARERTIRGMTLAGGHDYLIYRDPDTGLTTFRRPQGVSPGKALYSGWGTNLSFGWSPTRRRPAIGIPGKLTDLAHTVNLLQGPTLKEAGSAQPQVVGMAVRRLKFIDGLAYCIGISTGALRVPRASKDPARAPVIWPQGGNRGRRYPKSDLSAPGGVGGDNGPAILACFFATPVNSLMSGSSVRLREEGATYHVAGIRRVYGQVLYFIPRRPLKKKTRYRIDVRAEVKPHGRPLFKRDFIRYFTTGKGDYGV